MISSKPVSNIVWLRDETLEGSDNLPPPDIIAAKIMEGPPGRGAVCQDCWCLGNRKAVE
jgi:hypothetical protein